MDTDLRGIAAALAELGDDGLYALSRTIEHAPPRAPGLLAYLSHVCDHEHGRRRRRDFPLREPREAIPHEELGAAFAAFAALMIQFKPYPRARTLIEAVGDARGEAAGNAALVTAAPASRPRRDRPGEARSVASGYPRITRDGCSREMEPARSP
jgi:hypothetical protein